MNREEKKQHLSEVIDVIKNSGSIIFARNLGISVPLFESLRNSGRENSVKVKVIKNTVVKIAAKENDLDFDDLLSGSCVMFFSEDLVAPAKVVADFCKANKKLQIVGGLMGRDMLDEDAVKRLSLMPTLEESRSMLVGVINQPASSLARLLKEPSAMLARVVKTKAE